MSVFWGISDNTKHSGGGGAAELRQPHNSKSDHWNRSALSCYRPLWPLWEPCQSCDWPAWVIYTLPRVSRSHVARKWHITAANHALAAVTWATVRAPSRSHGKLLLVATVYIHYISTGTNVAIFHEAHLNAKSGSIKSGCFSLRLTRNKLELNGKPHPTSSIK